MQGQISKLYLRGSIISVIRDMSDEDRKRVEELMDKMRNHPEMQRHKWEFASSLAGTIGDEYLNKDAANADMDIAFMKAAADILVNKRLNIPEKQMLKLFKSYLWNYLKQILNENKRKYRKYSKVVYKPVHMAIAESMRSKFKCEYEEVGSSCAIYVEPDKVNEAMLYLNEYEGIYVSVQNDAEKCAIILTPLNNPPQVAVEVQMDDLIGINNYDVTDEASVIHSQCDEGGSAPDDPWDDTMNVVRQKLSTDAEEVLDIILDTPEDYSDIVGSTSTQPALIARYLCHKKRTTDEAMIDSETERIKGEMHKIMLAYQKSTLIKERYKLKKEKVICIGRDGKPCVDYRYKL